MRFDVRSLLKLQPNSRLVVTGHSNPDVDSVCAAIALKGLLSGKGFNTVAIVDSQLGRDTEYALRYAKADVPFLRARQSLKNDVFVLVDHHAPEHMPAFVDKDRVVGVIDHHMPMQGAELPENSWIRAVGSTCTLVVELYRKLSMSPRVSDSKLLVAGILSDTKGFKSGTVVQHDIDAYNFAMRFTKLDNSAELYTGMRESLMSLSPVEMWNFDSKPYNFGWKTISISNVVVDDLHNTLATNEDGISLLLGDLNSKMLFMTSPDENMSCLFYTKDLERFVKSKLGSIALCEQELKMLLPMQSRKSHLIPALS